MNADFLNRLPFFNAFLFLDRKHSKRYYKNISLWRLSCYPEVCGGILLPNIRLLPES